MGEIPAKTHYKSYPEKVTLALPIGEVRLAIDRMDIGAVLPKRTTHMVHTIFLGRGNHAGLDPRGNVEIYRDFFEHQTPARKPRGQEVSREQYLQALDAHGVPRPLEGQLWRPATTLFVAGVNVMAGVEQPEDPRAHQRRVSMVAEDNPPTPEEQIVYTRMPTPDAFVDYLEAEGFPLNSFALLRSDARDLADSTTLPARLLNSRVMRRVTNRVARQIAAPYAYWAVRRVPNGNFISTTRTGNSRLPESVK